MLPFLMYTEQQQHTFEIGSYFDFLGFGWDSCFCLFSEEKGKLNYLS